MTKLLLTASFAASARVASAIDFRFDVATDASTSDNTDWFGPSQLPALNFPSLHGHDIEQGNSNHLATIAAAGNTLGMYYDPFYTLYPTQTATQAVTTINNYANNRFGSGATSRWLVLNEVSAAIWQGSDGDNYRTWLVDTINGLHNAGYNNIVLYSPRYLASKTYASTWQALASKAYIGLETFLDGHTINNNYNFSLSQVQAYYQGYYNSWTSTTNGPGLSPSRLFAGEHFSVNKYDPSQYWGANGISGTDWQAAIEIRDIAIHNIPFGGFIGYAWDKDAQATGDDNTDLNAQLSYEKAYASTLTVQTEVACWTGNDGTGTWNDYLNWTGGFPSTTAAPYPLLAATNPTLPKQTTANFLNNIKQTTIIALNGNQSTTHLTLDSPFSYIIGKGTTGSLTITGSGSAIAVNSGSHSISAPVVVASSIGATLTGSLTISGSLANNGYTITKMGSGWLHLSGIQTNAANSALIINAGAVKMDTDGGSAGNQQLTVQVGSAGSTGATMQFSSSEHLHSLQVNDGNSASVSASANKLLHVGTLSVGPSARLDLNDADLIVDSGNFATINNLVLQGYRNSSDPTATGIASTTGQTSAGNPILAIFDNSKLKTANWPLGSSETVGANAIIGKYTYFGDTNLDGMVTADDYGALDANFGAHVGTPDEAGGMGWIEGDTNMDGDVTADDYGALDANFGLGVGQPLGAQGGAAVPEPAAWSAVSVAAIFGHRRRRKFEHGSQCSGGLSLPGERSTILRTYG